MLGITDDRARETNALAGSQGTLVLEGGISLDAVAGRALNLVAVPSVAALRSLGIGSA